MRGVNDMSLPADLLSLWPKLGPAFDVVQRVRGGTGILFVGAEAQGLEACRRVARLLAYHTVEYGDGRILISQFKGDVTDVVIRPGGRTPLFAAPIKGLCVIIPSLDKRGEWLSLRLKGLMEHARIPFVLLGTAANERALPTYLHGHYYVAEDGIIRRCFDRAFDELKIRYPEWNDLSSSEVQAAYFAEQRHRGGEAEALDSFSGESKQDEAAYDLIMRDKEALLSFPDAGDDEDTRRKRRVAFIFSHSALREGWDNPNVFQICTLNQTASVVKKRQEVGRGVRLAVDQSGERVHDESVNVLTVVANESYRKYVEDYQSEIAFEDPGRDRGEIPQTCRGSHRRRAAEGRRGVRGRHPPAAPTGGREGKGAASQGASALS